MDPDAASSQERVRGLDPRALLSRAARHADSDGGQRVGDYELLDQIAEGGMGVVYRAHQISLQRMVERVEGLYAEHLLRKGITV